ncbi:reverse transcriptase domain-containing protein [Tanacetum coccineum]
MCNIATYHIACLRAVGDISDFGDPNTRQGIRRKIKIENLNGNIIELTLWDEMAKHFEQADIKNMEQPVITAVSSCRVSKYRDYQLSSSSTTYYYLNSKIPEGAESRAIRLARENKKQIPIKDDNRTESEQLQARPLLQGYITDMTATASITFFSPTADKVADHPCTELVEKYKPADPKKIPPEILVVQGKTDVFQFLLNTLGNLKDLTIDDVFDLKKQDESTGTSAQEPSKGTPSLTSAAATQSMEKQDESQTGKEKHLAEEEGSDKSKITRKQSKASKHGHENQKSTKPKPQRAKALANFHLQGPILLSSKVLYNLKRGNEREGPNVLTSQTPTVLTVEKEAGTTFTIHPSSSFHPHGFRVDYSQLGMVLLVPEIDWKIKSLMGFQYKCFLDAYKGYHQIQMTKKDEEKTAFHTEEGVFCYTKMPFGLKNAGATYQRLVDSTFKEQIGVNLEAYANDMVIKSKTKQDIIKDIEQTFSTLRRINMKLNPKKCSFAVEEGKFLGYVVTSEGIRANPEKAKAVMDMSSPKTLKQMQSLSGKLAALNSFLSKSVERSLPFLDTLKKCTNKKDFRWTEAAEAAFPEIKKLVSELQTLTTPKKGETLIMYLAATNEAVSVVLLTERNERQMPIHYVSRSLQGAKTNYASMEKLALALVHAARRLRRYFQAYPITVITDSPIGQVLNNSGASGSNKGPGLSRLSSGHSSRDKCYSRGA